MKTVINTAPALLPSGPGRPVRRVTSHRRLGRRAIARLALALTLAFALAGCLGAAGGGARPRAGASPAATLPVTEPGGAVETSLGAASDVVSGAESLTFRLALDPRETADEIARCLAIPPGRSPRVELSEIRLRRVGPWTEDPMDAAAQAEILARNGDAIERAARIVERGVARRSHLYAFFLRPEFTDSQSKDRYRIAEATVTARWKEAWEPRPLRDPAYLSASSPWLEALSKLAVNGSALAAYASDELAPAQIPLSAPDTVEWRPGEGSGSAAKWAKIPVEEEGLFSIDWTVLKNTGWKPEEIDPKRLRLYCGGREIPALLLGGLTPGFTVRDRLLFWGTPSESPMTRRNVYFLEVAAGEEKPLTFSEAPPLAAAPRITLAEWRSREKLEEDLLLHAQEGEFLSIRGLRWIWASLRPDEPWTTEFALPGHLEAPEFFKSDCELQITLLAVPGALYDPEGKVVAPVTKAPPRGQVVVKVNGAEGEPYALSGKMEEYRVALRFAPGALKAEGNTLEITWTGAAPASSLFLDCVEVEYPRRLQMSGKAALELDLLHRPRPEPVALRVEGAAPADLLAFSLERPERPRLLRVREIAPDLAEVIVGAEVQGRVWLQRKRDALAAGEALAFVPGDGAAIPEAQALVITAPSLRAAAEQLVAIWKESGVDGAVVDVESIYNHYSGGLLDPAAIKRFVRDAVTRPGGAPPHTITLLGDCTNDYRGVARNSIANLVPTLSRRSSGFSSQDSYATDHWFSTVVGEDDLADALVSRISATTPEDAAAVVAKSRAARAPAGGAWRRSVGLVADNGESFVRVCDSIRLDETPPDVNPRAVYLPRLAFEDNFYIPPEALEGSVTKVSPVATRMIESLFEDGVAILGFFGHGSPNIWSDWRMWFGGDSPNSDNLRLTNGDRLPLVFNGTCNSGAIDYPLPKWNICISEDMLRQREGGALACFVPSGPGFTTSHEILSKALFRGAFRLGIRRVAPLCELARLTYQIQGGSDDLARMFILLGDPLAALPGTAPGPAIEVAARPVEGGSWRVTARMPASYAIEPGETALWIAYGPDGQELARESGPAGAPFVFETPPGAEGLAQVTLCLSRESADSAAGPESALPKISGAMAHVGRARVAITAQGILEEGRDAAPGEKTLLLKVENTSRAPASGRARILREAPGEEAAEAAAEDFSLGALESRTLALRAAAREGLNVYRIAFDPGEGTAPLLAAELPEPVAFLVPRPGVARDLALARTSLAPRANGDINQAAVQVILANCGSQDWPAGTLRLLNAQGELLATRQIPQGLPAGQVRRWDLFAPWPEGRQRETWRVEPAAEQEGAWEDERPADNRLTLTIHPGELPDLAVVPGSLVLRPESPMEGETLFLEVQVENRGAVDSAKSRIAAFQITGEAGRRERLRNLSVSREESVPPLPPGGRARARTRWDPAANLAIDRIEVVADAGKESADADRSNNAAESKLRVRRKWQLTPGRMEVTRGEGNALRLIAKIRNSGESPAHYVVAAFYLDTDHTPENRLGEVMKERIEPGETAEFLFDWKLQPSDVGRTVRPSFEAYIKGSLLRVSSASGE